MTRLSGATPKPLGNGNSLRILASHSRCCKGAARNPLGLQPLFMAVRDILPLPHLRCWAELLKQESLRSGPRLRPRHFAAEHPCEKAHGTPPAPESRLVVPRVDEVLVVMHAARRLVLI